MAKSIAQCADLLPAGLTPADGQALLAKHFAGAVLVGVDEVGRGPLAGPVVACAAVLNPQAVLPVGLTDSKKLTAHKRDLLYTQVQDACLCFAIAEASVAEIDSMNILQANFLAMRRALAALGWADLDAPAGDVPVFSRGTLPLGQTAQILIDGNLPIKGVSATCQLPVVKGDGRVACIAAASVLAKVYRDRLMATLGEQYPGYGFDKHAGYGTATHLQAIRALGFSPVHRKSFKPKSLQGQMGLWD
jgi:ribonuclease HII